MIALITYFPAFKPSASSESDPLIPWLDVFGNVRKCSPLVFLNLFEKLAAIHTEVDAKFLKAADEKKKASSSLPSWSKVYTLVNLTSFTKLRELTRAFHRFR